MAPTQHTDPAQNIDVTNPATGEVIGRVPKQSEADVERILNEDPFYVAEVIQARLIREWNPVIRAF